MTFNVVRVGKGEVYVRNDDDDDLISFKVRPDAEPEIVFAEERAPSQGSKRPILIAAAREAAETEARRLGWLKG